MVEPGRHDRHGRSSACPGVPKPSARGAGNQIPRCDVPVHDGQQSDQPHAGRAVRPLAGLGNNPHGSQRETTPPSHRAGAAAGAVALAAALGLGATATPASAAPATTASSAGQASSAAPGLQVTCTVAGTHAGGQPISTSATTATVPHFLIDDDLGVPYPDPSGRQTLAGDAPGSNKFSPQLVVGQDAFNNGILVAPNVLLEDSTGVPRIYIQTATPAATFTTLERIIAQNPDRGRALSREIRTIQAGNTLYPDYRDLVTPIVKQVQIPTFVGGKLVGEPATLTCQR